METTELIIRCLKCGQKNRLIPSRLNDRPVCGKCRSPLDELILHCFFCGAKNRVFEDRIHDRPICGKCHLPLYRSAPKLIVGANFQEEILNFPGTVLVGWLNWSEEGGRKSEILNYFAFKYAGAIKTVQIDLHEDTALKDQFNLTVSPTFLIFCNGRLLKRFLATTPKELIEEGLLETIKECTTK